MPIDVERQRARWKRNKAAERERKRAETLAPSPVDPETEKKVWSERDKRLRNFPWNLPRLSDGRSHHRRLYEETYALVCDVWAVELLQQQRTGQKRVSDGIIANELWKAGRRHGVKKSSLRTKVWRARRIVRYLEDAPSRDGKGRYWPRFPDSVAEHGSWLKQQTDDVLRFLKLEGHIPSDQ